MYYDLEILHKCKIDLNLVADLISEEWPKSRSLRINRLSKSCDELPYHMILSQKNLPTPRINCDEDKSHAYAKDKDVDSVLLGHSSIFYIYGNEKACYLKTVVIKKSERSKGIGKILMKMTEDHIKKLGFDTVFLDTSDKEAFYAKMGYKVTDERVVCCGYMKMNIKSNIFKNESKILSNDIIIKTPQITKPTPTPTSTFNPAVCIPPPPALPNTGITSNSPLFQHSTTNSNLVYMVKLDI